MDASTSMHKVVLSFLTYLIVNTHTVQVQERLKKVKGDASVPGAKISLLRDFFNKSIFSKRRDRFDIQLVHEVHVCERT
jgi:hypothetical protein